MFRLESLALIMLFLSATAITAYAEQKGKPSGQWDVKTENAPDLLTPEQEDEIERLSALGYLDGTETTVSERMITVYDEKSSFNGVSLYVSAHAAEAILLDMRGAVLHRWRFDESVHADALKIASPKEKWQMAHAYPNGDIVVLQHHEGILKLNKDSKLIWALSPGKVHHDLDVMENGEIFVLTRTPKMMPWLNENRPIMDDSITQIDENGEIVRVVSILECLRNAGEDELLQELRSNVERHTGDILHTNSIEILDGRIADRVPQFKKGRALISVRRIDCLMVVDLDKVEVVWWMKGAYRNQHDARVLDNGNLLLFDNNQFAKRSAVREIDPVTGEEKWDYIGTKETPFFTYQSGRSQRLPNGNTLIVDSPSGRVFEVNRAKEIVWEFWNPERAGKDDKFIARIFECIRYPLTYFDESIISQE